MKEVLDRLIDDFHERDLPALLPREAAATVLPGKANVVIGMRRAGKTWFCYQQMQELLAQGFEKERLLYLNFEDERLLPFAVQDFQDILETYFRKFPAFKNQQCVLFLDEVQRIDSWDRFVRRVLDTEQLQVWVTGSSSKLLSSEIATSLRGRSLTTEIFPFSFPEFLRLHQIELQSTQRFGSQTRAAVQQMAGAYFKQGGFPEVQTADDETRRQILRNYVDVVILRDVVERYTIRNTVAVRALIRHIMAAPATRFSVNKFSNTLKSQGIACAKNDLYGFLDHLADAFLVYVIPIHSRSYKVRQVNPKKVYVIDTGLLEAMSFRMTEDRGALLENLVYLHLRRQGLTPEYYITDSGAEVDFVLQTGAEPQLIQVCWSLDDADTRQRELRALRQAMQELRIQTGTIVTWMDEIEEEGGVAIVPAWKWLLSPLE